MGKDGKDNKKGDKFNKKSDLETNFKLVKKEHDPRFGDCQIVADNKGHRLLLKEKISNSEKDGAKDIRSAEERIKLNHQYLQKMEDWTSSKKSDWCSTYYKVRGYYEWPESNLENLIAQHRKTNTVFSHETLIHITYQMLDGLCWIHTNKASFDDVRPMFVGTRHMANEFVLCDRLADPSNAKTCQTNRMISGANLYMSPALFKGICEKKKDIHHNSSKSDSFSLGMVLLEAGTLDSVQDVYNKSKKEVDEDRLHHHIENFKHRYAQEARILCEIVENLLRTKEDERPGCCEILKSAPCYQEIKACFNQQVVEHVPAPVVEKVVERAPVVVHHEPVNTMHEVREVRRIVETAPTEVRREVVKMEPRIIRQEVAHEPVTTSEPVVVRKEVEPVVVTEPVVVRKEVEPVVIKREEPVVRTSIAAPVVRRVEGEVRRVEGNVIRSSHQGEVIRSSHRVVEAPKETVIRSSHRRVEGEVRRVEGENVVRRVEGEVRRVEGEVRRVEGNVVRTSHVDGVRSSNVVRRVEGPVKSSHHPHTTTVRRSIVGGQIPTVVSGTPQANVTVRRVAGPPKDVAESKVIEAVKTEDKEHKEE